MTVTVDQLRQWMCGKEDEHLEFKEAKDNYHFEKLVKYCAALSNEGGGSIVLGVTNRLPRRIVGSSVFPDLERTKVGLLDRLHLRIDVEEIVDPAGRVVIFTVPPRPVGFPVAVEGAYWMRAGESLVPMTQDLLRRIFEETGPDFSAEICPGATLDDLDPRAVESFRTRWHRRARIDAIMACSVAQLLRDAELVTERGVTYAALALLGTHAALGRYLAQAEVVFEYRSSETPGPANQREEFREGFLAYYDRLWELVNLRNDRQHYQDGLFMLDMPTFNEGAVREAILNAVAHRDYRHAGSVFIRQFSRRIEIVSPGGFPQGITPENILDRQLPRNRRIADALGRCGLVERAGQGANRIFEACIREGKELPDFTNTDAFQVSLTLHGQLRDARFVRFLEQVGLETHASFDTHDLLVLDSVHREIPLPQDARPRLSRLVDLGILERVGHGRGTRYLLSRRFHAALGDQGGYTRRRGLDRETNKTLLLRHIEESHGTGARFDQLQQVLPGLSRHQVQTLLRELKRDGWIEVQGTTKAARWFPTAPKRNSAQ